MNIFQVKSKPGNIERADEFVSERFVAIGWEKTGSLQGVDKEAIRAKLKDAYEYDGQSLLTNLGTVNTFVNTMEEGDVVLIANGDMVHIGIIGPYRWEPNYLNIYCAHMRPVEWKAQVRRNELNDEVRSLLRNGTSVTKFKHPFHVAEIDRYLGLEPVSDIPSYESKESLTSKVVEQTDLAAKALKILEAQLNSENEQIAHEAAKEILRYLKS